MKTITQTLFVAALLALAVAYGLAQTAGPEEITVPLSNPSQPAFLKVSLMNGAIHVKAYSGKDVVVRYRSLDEHRDHDEDEDRDDDADKLAKRKGMKRLTNTSSALSVEEEDNEVTVRTGWRSMGTPLELTIQVPKNASMKLNTMNEGDITVEGISGDVEVSNMNGKVILTDISGSVVADAMNEDIRVSFSGLDAKKVSSFSSMNGDIDVTLPSSVKASLRLKNDMGEIYSDFDMKLETSPSRVEEGDRGKRGRYRVTMEKVMTGTLNGGGAEMTFKNFNGDIYIRKGK